MKSKLLLMRHGRSVWNHQNLFTGWVDIPMDEGGIQECIKAGEKLCQVPIDVVYTSALIRAQMTVVYALLRHSSGKIPVFLHPEQGEKEKIYSDSAKKTVFPVHIASALNERNYGQLQGLNKAETAEKYGQEQVQVWRRSFEGTPPGGESLAMTAERTLPYFQKEVMPQLNQGKTVLVAAHGNSLRSIVMFLDQLSKEEVVQLEFPTGDVWAYTLEHGKWKRE
jgi:2,3-bisphosphoglycerate-dependent phosphoglycerate mutase